MKVGRSYIGKNVELVWVDPVSGSSEVRRDSHERLPVGLKALGRWFERGVIIDLTDGVVCIQHSFGQTSEADGDDTHTCTWVPEELVQNITIYVPEVQP